MGMAERIKERRTSLGFTQEELATKLGLQKSAIAKYENGRVKNIKRTVILRMAEVLECPPSYLMDIDDDRKAITEDTIEHLTPREKAHLRNYRDLDDDNKTRVEGLTASLLSAQQEAADYLIAAHARTDIEASEEMVNHDLELLKKKARW